MAQPPLPSVTIQIQSPTCGLDTMHKPIRTILYGEAILNTLIALGALLLPDRFIALFTGQPSDPIAAAFVRWYGVLLLALIYVLLKALRNGSIEALKPVVQAHLMVDVLLLAAIWMLADAVNRWSSASIVLAAISLFFAIIQIYALWWRLDLLANLHPASWSRPKRRKSES